MAFSWRRRFGPVAVALCVSGIASSATAQTVDELLAKNLQARGGLERLKAVETIKLTAKVTGSGQQMTITTWMKRPNLVRQEMSGAQGQTLVQAFDGTRAWMLNTMMGASTPSELPAAQAEQLKNNADFDGPFVDYRAKGHTIELLGQEMFEGARVYRLRVTKKDGPSQLVFLDAETGLERRLTAQLQQGGQTMTVDQVMSDFRSVSGLMIAFSTRTIVNGQLVMSVTVGTAEVNTPIDDSLFRMPGK